MSQPSIATSTCTSGTNCAVGSLCTSSSQCATGNCCGWTAITNTTLLFQITNQYSGQAKLLANGSESFSNMAAFNGYQNLLNPW